MIVISSREFRQNQKMYFDKVDSGEHIIVQRGKDKSYALTPINENDVFINAEMLVKLKKSIQERQEGNSIKIDSSQGISKLLGLWKVLTR